MPHTLTHEAMATTFRLVIAHGDAAYARQAAAEAFAELDRLEARLSRFAEGSDIWRINRLRAGEAAFVHHDTLECLRLAEEVRRETAGAFDVAHATRAPMPPASDAGGGTGFQPVSPPTIDGALFELEESSHTVRVLTDGLRLDLGGIGKGFALDRMAALLREWEIASALLCASTSTLLALDPPPGEEGWPAELCPDDAPRRLTLANQALSASGTGVKGDHIIDPRTGRPAEGRLRAWAIAPTAALADALSTAFMVMTRQKVRAYCRHRPCVSAWVLGSPTGASTAFP
ncbi:MAG: FAD:protein FMN transferase [Planctomycetes bacterium]|nr:FAD:protein FMN transferase [Planctomycetota bacterium]